MTKRRLVMPNRCHHARFTHPSPTIHTELDRLDRDIVSFNQIIMLLTSRGACLTGNERPEINDVLADYTYVLH